MSQSRLALDLDGVVTSFLSNCQDESERLARDLAQLDDEGRRSLGGVLGRFDRRGDGYLDAVQRLQARRILGKLKRPSASSLALLNRVLDYLDFNSDSRLSDEEAEICVQILERFARIDSNNESLSDRELRLLYAVIRGIDEDSNLSLDARERAKLKTALENPEVLIAEQQVRNPMVREVLGLP